jgi:hypothetical protein
VQPSRKLLVVPAAIFLAVAGIALRVFAVSYPLSTTAIRNAYFIGNRNDERTAEFLSKYIHRFPEPKSGAYIREIGIDTPFSNIVKRTQGRANFYAPDAVQEFQKERAVGLRLHVDIFLTAGYSPMPHTASPEYSEWVPDFWNDFKVNLVQDGLDIPAERVRGGPIYSYGYDPIPLVTGARIELSYSPGKIDSEPTQVVVLTPDGQTVETTFDLARLR